MKSTSTLLLTLALALLSASSPATGQESSAGKKPIPQLTTEDVLRHKGAQRTTVDGGTANETSASGSGAATISSSWYSGAGGYAQAELEREQTGAPMAVYFYTNWCKYCRQLELNILPSSEVSDYFSRVIKVKINPEDGREEEALARRYAISGYPSFFMVGSGSRPRKITPYKRQGGGWVPVAPADFVAACQDALALNTGVKSMGSAEKSEPPVIKTMRETSPNVKRRSVRDPDRKEEQ